MPAQSSSYLYRVVFVGTGAGRHPWRPEGRAPKTAFGRGPKAELPLFWSRARRSFWLWFWRPFLCAGDQLCFCMAVSDRRQNALEPSKKEKAKEADKALPLLEPM